MNEMFGYRCGINYGVKLSYTSNPKFQVQLVVSEIKTVMPGNFT